jgi:branched-chain amino acid aminotransferase
MSNAGFPKTEWIWRDGEFIRWEDATVHVMAHVVHYGSSVIEGIRSYETPDGAAIFRLKAHVKRFYESARIYRMEIAASQADFTAACHELLERNGLKECYLRPVAYRGLGTAGLYPMGSPTETVIVCWPWGAYLGAGALEQGVDVKVSTWTRPAPNTHPTIAKAGGNYLSSQLMRIEAQEDGYAEAIGLSVGGLVSEGSGQNVFIIRNGELMTPAIDGTILAGITRECVIQLAQDMGITVREGPIPREMLYVADEVFMVGTATEVTPVRSVDRVVIGEGKAGPITRKIQQQYVDIARGQAPDRYGWLDYAPKGSAIGAR